MADDIFKRVRNQPIITPEHMPFKASAVFNPGVVAYGNEVLLLLRIEDRRGISQIRVARSRNGVDHWRIDEQPLLEPDLPGYPLEEWGCEDARVTQLGDELWIIAYTAYSRYGPTVALATTSDFLTVNRLGAVLSPLNKDAAVFPRKIGDNYWMLHRPAAGDIEHIWLTVSDDLVHWGRPWCVLMERGGPMWDGYKVGANTVPVETPEGWLILYHGVKQFPAGPMYRMGLALLDLEDPRRVIARLPYWVLGPHEPYEVSGAVPNVVFACGHTQIGDLIHVYYGAADSTVCLATASVSELLEALGKYRI